MASFRDIKEGDLVYEVCTYGRGKKRRQWVTAQKVVSIWERGSPARGGLFKTLPCYPDGTVYLFFGMWFRRSSGVEYGNHEFKPPTDRPHVRLLREPPEGIPIYGGPESIAPRKAA